MQLKGKQIKQYVIGDTLASYQDMQLLSGHTLKGQEISILMIDKKLIQQTSFVAYNNLLQENTRGIHPKYIQPIQSSNNIYIILQKIQKISTANITYQNILYSLIYLYLNIGEYKVEEEELFIDSNQRVLYLPLYKRINTSSKFYAQFHNKSTLGEIFARLTSVSNKNRVLEIFIQNIDSPNAYETITRLIEAEVGAKVQYPSLNEGTQDEDKDDEQIMKLMSDAKVNTQMKKQAGDIFKRHSVKRFQQQSDKQLNHIMQLAKSNLHIIKKSTLSQQLKTKMEVKLSVSKVEQNQFELYFKSYYESLRFLKHSIKVFLSYYKNGFSGIVISYMIIVILSLRKAYMIRDLQCGIDIFQLNIDMTNAPIKKCIAIISHELKSEARMIAELRNLLENCQMPVKTYTILAPFLEEDISNIDLEHLQSFTFFFLSQLMKGREKGKLHFMYFIECMYILLHKNYQIVFFQSDFPGEWNENYFETKIALIQAILPNWSFG